MINLGVKRPEQRARVLLDMLYTGSELADVFGTSRRAIVERWITLGLPHTQDEHGRYWFSGREVYTWISLVSKRKALTPQEMNTWWCRACGERVEVEHKRRIEKGERLYIKADCTQCGMSMTRMYGSRGAKW